MGLAASQARYLELSARKTNCEYEGQQINQQRLVLSNQSADLFNQMLTMAVPMPPSSSEFTRLQYSWTDGNFVSVIDNYYQLSEPDEKYNYIVSSYHYENKYVGQKKYLTDPQVQAKKTNHFTANTDKTYTVTSISYNRDKDSYTFELTNALQKKVTATFRPSDQNTNKDITEQLDCMYATDRIAATEKPSASGYIEYTINTAGTEVRRGTGQSAITYAAVAVENPTELQNLKQTFGAFFDASKKYFKRTTGSGTDATTTYICWDDVNNAQISKSEDVIIRKLDTNKYYTDGTNFVKGSDLQTIAIGGTLSTKSATNNPTFSDYSAVGNCQLTQITEEMYQQDTTLDAEIKQILKDMSAEGGDPVAYQRLKACFDDDGKYITGSLYKFTLAGKTYYTTPADLDESLLSAYSTLSIADNGIDSQQSKLAYYNTIYTETKVSEIKKALMESDGKGRFSTVKFEDDSVVYTLKVETIKDEDAYNDAMNKYFYEKEQYDKQVADINTKTEVIQAQDRQLQLKLEQLGTEQTALQTEMEACQKIVSKNIENSFKTFNG